MAASSRLRLLARGLVENRIKATVLCSQVSETAPVIENRLIRGIYRGIPFEYTTGVTVRSESFLMRRLVEIKGLFRTILRLEQMKRREHIDFIYPWGGQKLTVYRVIFHAIARFLKIPVIFEINEQPWSLIPNCSSLARKLSPLAGATGAVVISHFLRDWAEKETARREQEFAVLHIPILVDVDEQQPTDYPSTNQTVLFAGSPGYSDTIKFILDALQIVWRSFPRCRLVITGCRERDPAGAWLAREIRQRPSRENIELTGYLSRQQLLQRYSDANALLIPLFDDTVSRARFPTKIGEYLASGRPIVTNSVGETEFYFKDSVNAFLCPPNDPGLFAAKISQVLSSPTNANRVGLEGRRLAQTEFNYKIHGPRFASFLNNLRARRSSAVRSKTKPCDFASRLT